MAISTSCCLNLPPPIPTLDRSSSKQKPISPQVAGPSNQNWRKQCVLGIASMIIGLQASNLDVNSSRIAMAKDVPFIVMESKEKVARWSDKRMCPPWHVNSLETIVPENLPRPSAHRRWEAVGYTKNAPPLQINTKTSCFSM